jgi:hypothetical protein
MNPEQHSKISASHLVRHAYVYVRQSTLRQVLENTESTKRQYGCASGRSRSAGPPTGSS